MSKKLDTPKVSGIFHTIATVRDSSNIQSYSIVTVELKDGVAVNVSAAQPDSPSVIFQRADQILRATTKPIEQLNVQISE